MLLTQKSNKDRFRLVIVSSHPIQYQTPFFQILAKYSEIDLKVFFCSDFGLKEYLDEGFGQKFKWDIPLLEGYNYEFLHNLSLWPNPSKFFGLINPAIMQKIKNESFDAIWIHGWSSLTNWLAIFTAFSCGIPVLLRSETNLLPKITRVKAFIKKKILSQLFKNISGFLAIGKYNAEFYEAFGAAKEKIFLVPYAVDNEFFLSKANELFLKKELLKEKFNIPKNLPVILFSGKLIDVKRPMDLLQAYAMTLKEKECALVYIGDGSLRKHLESYCFKNNLKNVYFMGFKNQSELGEFYAIADIFVLPSELEPWGLVVNEAMCFGLPLILSDQVGALGDLVKEGVNGFIYPCGDINALKEKLKVLLVNDDLMQKYGLASREIIKKWSYKKGVESLLECLKVIKKNRNKNLQEKVTK